MKTYVMEQVSKWLAANLISNQVVDMYVMVSFLDFFFSDGIWHGDGDGMGRARHFFLPTHLNEA